MCMFALTVSIVEPKNIKEAMADSAWIEAMQEELHQFDRLQVWELVDKPFGKNGYCSGRGLKDFEEHITSQLFRFGGCPIEEEVYVATYQMDSLILIIRTKFTSKKELL
ncbi:hypothetical protein Tco_0771102 [Tanacetum coccineum]|uniref:Gag-Pol polyprotein n=1 Tax=Tanacetum coccineum TaxID=301880 RepID=A0ABQ4ZFZ2_9ASTR